MDTIKSVKPEDLSLRELHGTMLSAVGPRPICFASTIDANGNVNLSPFSFFNVFSSKPPLMIFSPARSGKTNTNKDTFHNVQEVKEVVINIVNYPLVEQMSLSSTAYDKGINEFVKAGLTEVKSTLVKPPRVLEAPVAFECTVENVIELGNEGGAGNLIFAKVVMIHIHPEILHEEGHIDPHKLDLVGRMGQNWYCRASGDALFEVKKPLGVIGIGIDQLPDYIKHSEKLSGNQLGILGGADRLPTTKDMETFKEIDEIKEIINSDNPTDTFFEMLSDWIEQRKSFESIMLLMLLQEL